MTRTVLSMLTTITLGLGLSTNALADDYSMATYEAEVYLSAIESAISQTNGCLETAQLACETGDGLIEGIAWLECGIAAVSWTEIPDTYGQSVPEGYEMREYYLLLQAAEAIANMDTWASMECR
jgi:hypothetical protein